MPVIVQQQPPSSGGSVASDIVACVSQDVRGILQTTGNDVNIILDYTNRISLELLRYSRWKFLLSPVQSFTTTLGVTDYWIGPIGTGPVGTTDTGLNIANLQSIKRDSVMDRTNFRRLSQTEEAPLSQDFALNGRPRVWRNDSSTPLVLNIYPPADDQPGPYTIQFRYYQPRTQITSVGQGLQIPADYKDVVCAGVNYLAYKYLQKDEDTQFWFSAYQAGKQSIIRDKNLFPADGDYIRPDPLAVVRSSVTGTGLDSGLETSIP